MYVVDFFAASDAANFKKRAAQLQNVAQPKKVTNKVHLDVTGEWSGIPLPPGLEQIPTPFKSKKSPIKPEAKVEALNSKPKQQGYRVLISGLPKHLMTEKMMAAMLDQAGLEQDILSINVNGTFGRDKALVEMRTFSTAEQLVKHCEGCKWNPSGQAVTACHFQEEDDCSAASSPNKKDWQNDAAQVGSKRLTRDSKVVGPIAKPADRFSAWMDSECVSAPAFLGMANCSARGAPFAQGFAQLPKEAPVYVHTKPAQNATGVFATNSDASTNVSDSDPEEDRLGKGMTSFSWTL
jgi:hypothetical protein